MLAGELQMGRSHWLVGDVQVSSGRWLWEKDGHPPPDQVSTYNQHLVLLSRPSFLSDLFLEVYSITRGIIGEEYITEHQRGKIFSMSMISPAAIQTHQFSCC